MYECINNALKKIHTNSWKHAQNDADAAHNEKRSGRVYGVLHRNHNHAQYGHIVDGNADPLFEQKKCK